MLKKMKKVNDCKVDATSLDHVVYLEKFKNDSILRNKYCTIDIERENNPYCIMNFDEFVESENKWKEELKREEID